MNHFQDFINQFIEGTGISQSQIAKHTGIAQSMISGYVNGRKIPKAERTDAIAQLTATHPGYIHYLCGRWPVEEKIAMTEEQLLWMFQEEGDD